MFPYGKIVFVSITQNTINDDPSSVAIFVSRLVVVEKDILFFERVISAPLAQVPSDFCNLKTLQRKQKFRSLCRELLFLHGCIAAIHRHKMLNYSSGLDAQNSFSASTYIQNTIREILLS